MRKVQSPRILWNAKDHPSLPSGYGVITKHLVPRLADRYGKDNVLVYAPVYTRDRIEDWNGIKILPGVDWKFEDALLLEHYNHYRCNLLLQTGDWFTLRQVPEWAAHDQVLWIQWAPFDTLNLPRWARDTIRYALKVVPFTRYAETRLKDPEFGLSNIEPAIWLGLDTNIWYPTDRKRLPLVMASLGFADDTFNILMVQANQLRKYLREQLEGIRIFRQECPDAKVRIYLHCYLEQGGERSLRDDIIDLDLVDVVRPADPYVLCTGGLPEEQMAAIFNCADVVLDTCLEGFGYSIVQSQAVGVPVVVLAEGPGPELMRYGVTVPASQIDRNSPIQKPVADPAHIAQALGVVYDVWKQDPGARSLDAPIWARENLGWDVIAEQWFKVIDDAMEMRERYSLYIPEPSPKLWRRARQQVRV